VCWFALGNQPPPSTYLPVLPFPTASLSDTALRHPLADPSPDHVDRIGERPMILRDVATDRRDSCSGSQSGNNPYMRIHGRIDAHVHTYTQMQCTHRHGGEYASTPFPTRERERERERERDREKEKERDE